MDFYALTLLAPVTIAIFWLDMCTEEVTAKVDAIAIEDKRRKIVLWLIFYSITFSACEFGRPGLRTPQPPNPFVSVSCLP